MKGDLILGLVFFVAAALIPLSAIGTEAALPASGAPSSIQKGNSSQPPQSESQSTKPPEKLQPPEAVGSFKIFNQSTGKVFTMSAKDFVRGAVAAEMPASYEPEALKAQAVAAYTYAVRQSMVQDQTPNPDLKGADFAADPENYKVCITKDMAKQFYGDNFDVLWSKVVKAADSVSGEVLTYEGLPIAAAYHAISSGRTEAAENIWGQSLPCITPVDSEWDVYAPGYASQEIFNKSKIQLLFTDTYPEMKLSTNPEGWIEILERSYATYVTKLRVGDVEMEGRELRTLLGLRSTCFEVKYVGGNFIFDVRGYGHGAGLSQYGADYMARQGSTYEEILAHYYPDSQLVESK